MYCRHCGEEMNDNQAICVKCGVPVGSGDAYCANCGKEVVANAAVCISCGCLINDIRNIQVDKTTARRQKPNQKYAIVYTVIAAIATIFLLIPDYLYIDDIYMLEYYSFIEWMGGLSIIALLLLWANPIISFIGVKQKRSYILIKIIVSILLIIFVLAISTTEADGPGPMYFLTMLVLLGQIIVLIREALTPFIDKLTDNDSTQNYAKNSALPTIEQQSTTTSHCIFCKNCGVEMNSKQVICIKCGVAVGNGNLYCSNCGNAIAENAEFCIHCGVAVKPENYSKQNPASGEYLGGQDKTTVALICFFLGAIGIHHFIMGEKKKGIMKIVFWFIFGVSGILALVDFIRILTDKYKVNYNTYF